MNLGGPEKVLILASVFKVLLEIPALKSSCQKLFVHAALIVKFRSGRKSKGYCRAQGDARNLRSLPEMRFVPDDYRHDILLIA